MYGTVGFSYFATTSSASGEDDFVEFASSTHYDDVTFAVSGGGGLYLRLANGRRPVSLDLSAHTLVNGETTYLREGSIIETGGGLAFAPIRSEANLVMVKLGVSIGVL